MILLLPLTTTTTKNRRRRGGRRFPPRRPPSGADQKKEPRKTSLSSLHFSLSRLASYDLDLQKTEPREEEKGSECLPSFVVQLIKIEGRAKEERKKRKNRESRRRRNESSASGERKGRKKAFFPPQPPPLKPDSLCSLARRCYSSSKGKERGILAFVGFKS